MMWVDETTNFYRKRLPHWEVARGVYFITMHEAGSLPREVMHGIHQLAREAKSAGDGACAAAQRRIFGAMESALHRNLGDCCLRNPGTAKMVVEAIEHYHRQGTWHAAEYVLMPNHLHMLIELHEDSLNEVMLKFKRWTTRQANIILNRSGDSLWQREWFDHWSRTVPEDERILEYIRNNPVKAGLVKQYQDWPYGSWKIRPIK